MMETTMQEEDYGGVLRYIERTERTQKHVTLKLV